MNDFTIPKTYDEAIQLGYEQGATEEEFQEALRFHETLRKLEKSQTGTYSTKVTKKVECSMSPDGTVCIHVPCHNGWEYISTCFHGVCKPDLRRRC